MRVVDILLLNSTKIPTFIMMRRGVHKGQEEHVRSTGSTPGVYFFCWKGSKLVEDKLDSHPCDGSLLCSQSCPSKGEYTKHKTVFGSNREHHLDSVVTVLFWVSDGVSAPWLLGKDPELSQAGSRGQSTPSISSPSLSVSLLLNYSSTSRLRRL